MIFSMIYFLLKKGSLCYRIALIVGFTLFLWINDGAAEDSFHKNVLILPHVESNDNFYTGLSLLNKGDDQQELTITAFDERGQKLSIKTTPSLTQGAKFLNTVADLFGNELSSEISWIKVEFSGDFKGFGLIANEEQLTRIPLQYRPSSSLILPHIVTGKGIFTQVFLLNIGNDFTSISFSAYDSTGSMLKNIRWETQIAPAEKLSISISELFEEEIAEQISWLKVSSDTELIGLGLIGTPTHLISVPME